MKKVITGAKPTGQQLHIGNLLGAVLPFGELAKDADAAIFVADLHALNQITNADELRHNIDEIPYEYLAILGLDTPFTIFRQSDIHGIPMLQWVLNNVTPFSLMARAHSYKDFQQRKEAQIRNIAKTEGNLEMHKLIAADFGFHDVELDKIVEEMEKKSKYYQERIDEAEYKFEHALNM